MGQDRMTTRLARRLQRLIDERGLRRAADDLKLSTATLDRLANDKNKPDYTTLRDFASGLNLAPWQVLDMAEIPLGLPPERDAHIHRLLTLVSYDPQLLHVLTQLAAVHADLPSITQRVSDYLTFELQRQGVAPLEIVEEHQEATTESHEMTEAEYLGLVQNVAAQIAEEDRQSYWAALGRFAQRWLPKGSAGGSRKRPA